MPGPKVIILLHGKSGSGKDFLFQHRFDFNTWFTLVVSDPGLPELCDSEDQAYNWYTPEVLVKFKRYAFADYLKQLVGIPIDRRLTDDERIRVLDKALEMKKSEGESVFVDYVINKIKLETPEYVMITDFRFPIEYSEIKRQFPTSSIRVVWVRNSISHDDPDQANRSILNDQDFAVETTKTGTLHDYYTLRRIQEN